MKKQYITKELGINEKLAREVHSDIDKNARKIVKKLGKDWFEDTIGVFANIFEMMVVEEVKESLGVELE